MKGLNWLPTQIQCEKCNHRISYEDSPPKFCGECGGSLIQSISSIQADETVARTPVDLNSDLGGETRAQDQTRPISNEHIEKFNLETVGPYRLIRKLGQGGMGTVYEAVHTETGRSVALKLLSPEVRGTDEMVQRFRRESQIAASINHPRSTFVYESGQHEGQLYITMELMGGGTLKEVVADEGQLPVGRAVDYVLDMIDGLAVAHNAGIVHRDLKPSNSFVDTDGRIKVGDFGLAKSFLGDSSLTQTGTFMGTPQFAAPEQIRNADVDERTDIYALGGTLFYLLTGRAPFIGNPAQVISSIASDTPPKASEFARGIPKPLVKLISQTLEKDPSRRPFNLSMLRDGLLPFSTSGAMAADPGRRMAAFFLDIFVATIIASFPNVIVTLGLMLIAPVLNLNLNPQFIGVFVVIPTMVAYFAICENRWGRTLGKWWLGMRVVDKDLESPGLVAAFIRAALIPGFTSSCSTIATIYMLSTVDADDLSDGMALLALMQAVGLVFWIPLLLLISTARRSNGYTCVHGILSGTRVVRLSGDLQSRLFSQTAVTTPVVTKNKPKIDRFEIAGRFHADQRYHVYLGKDKELDRQIWLFDGFSHNPLSDERRNLVRPSRLRVIDESSHNDQTWYATESVPGLPLADVIEDIDCDWQSFYPLIRDIANELACSQEAGLVPENFSIDHCWLDRTGHVRILDHIVTPGRDSLQKINQGISIDQVKPKNPADVIAEILDRFMQKQEYPVELIRFRDELATRQNDDNVFHWVVERMNDMAERLIAWTRTDRIGMLAITLGLEIQLINGLLFATGYFYSQLTFGVAIQTALVVLTGLAIVAGFGYLFDGGMAVRMTNASLRRKTDMTKASKLRCAIRNVIAWLPWLTLISLLMFLIFHQLTIDPEVTNITLETSDVVGPVLLISILPMLLIFVGMIVTFISHRRGIPDWITGTVMIRN